MSPPIKHSGSLLFIILITGLLTGLLDGLAAIIQFSINGGKNPANIFKFIASGVFGKQAFAEGNIMLFWGVLFHFLIALLFTAFFFLVFPKIKWLGKNKVLAGTGYGIFVWAVMNLLVLPLSNTRPLPFDAGKAAIAALILVACIGLPVSLMAGKYYRVQRSQFQNGTK
ncbi:MAG: hypothetical protein ACT4OJ_12790 [Bacteroidota bacterium]